ncbi:CPA1 family monovalent cation:H+ antiporter [Larkinella arboricola]|uniref:CPA1 family monovalent cation:H+ antiporter n=1 Tax=Larkinella arboricola TaxID=643671 RepID=A0A327XFZ6_LARAB|nr:Na+/H+ antiporter [Larkinella arboricola]RAK03096.1 CPA1 family monovalent cation:H+ antiporter [Larkinella arboricola]
MREIVLLGLTLLLGMALLATLAQRLRIPTPIFLVLGGLLVSLIPGVPPISIEPELIFLVFLPPLLYEAAWFMSWRELWRWRRIVLVMAFGLVILTATAVAYASVAFIPGFTLAVGFLLGGIVSPPDAVAASSVLKDVDAPKSTLNILEGESLINDASSLIVFRFALSTITSGVFVWQEVAVDFVLVTIMGGLIGLAVAGIFYAIHRWIPMQPRITILLTFLGPYIMYMTAEHFHYSGVIAVMAGGLFLSNHSHRILNHTERVQGLSMWATVIFIINGLVFVLIGLELSVVVQELDGYSVPDAIFYGLIISGVLIVVRMVFALMAAGWTRIAGRFITVAVRNAGWRGPLVVGWAGMRGVVSLAAALSIPLNLPGGELFPHRSLILFITFVVILVTLVFQGLTLPMVIRWLHPKELFPRMPEEQQEAIIHRQLQEVALRELRRRFDGQVDDNVLLTSLKNRLESELKLNQVIAADRDGPTMARYHEARVGLSAAKRQELERLRRQEDFDEDVVRKIEAQLDLEEERYDHLIR